MLEGVDGAPPGVQGRSAGERVIAGLIVIAAVVLILALGTGGESRGDSKLP